MYIEIKKGGRKTMKEIEITKKMYETSDGKLFETKREAEEYELNLKCHKNAISFATRLREICNEYVNYNGNEECNPKCPFKYENDGCILDDYPCNWILPTL